MSCATEIIRVGARGSPLSRAQFVELQQELVKYHPDVSLEGIFVETRGDKDLQTSLRTLGKCDFFTHEVDVLLLSGEARVGVHSAKDLPNPLAEGLEVVCLTRGQDPADSLVMRRGESLKAGAVIATSSVRREEAVRQLRSDVTFRDVRGTIGQRLALLDSGEADGVVIAEAALIRLGLTHLTRVKLPGETVPLQGRLVVVARAGDEEMRELFSCLHIP